MGIKVESLYVSATEVDIFGAILRKQPLKISILKYHTFLYKKIRHDR